MISEAYLELGNYGLLKPRHKAAQTPCSPEEAAAIIERLGLRSDHDRPRARPSGPPRLPTVNDYIALGVARDVAARYAEEAARRSRSPAAGASR